MPETSLTKVSFNAVPNAMTALGVAADNAGLSRTDTLNRAVQTYAGMTTFGLWRAIRLLLSERKAVRRFAAEQVSA